MVYGSRFRERTFPIRPKFLGQSYRFNPANGAKSEIQDCYVPGGGGSTKAYIKRCWDETHPGPPYREGGPFTICEATTPYDGVQGSVQQRGSGTFNYCYDGGFVPMTFGDKEISQTSIGLMGLGGVYDENYLTAMPYGPEVYNRAKPRLEYAGLGQFLVELRDLPRQLKQTSEFFKDAYKSLKGDFSSEMMRPQRVADDFLNHQFGWVPFIGDLVKAYDTYQRSSSIDEQLTRDNGQWIKRSRVVEHTDSVSDAYRAISNTFPYIWPVLNGFQYIGSGSYTDFHVEKSTRVWFEAQFRYYRPEFDRGKPYYTDWYGKMNRAVTKYGLRVSPALIWKVTPWSWLADWFTNIGENLSYMTSQLYDGMVSRYAYVMKTTHSAVVNTSVVNFPGPGTKSFRGQWYQYLVTKDRREAPSPYGFSTTWDQLSPKQLAILAALGLSRGA